jgi:hypothetical protein
MHAARKTATPRLLELQQHRARILAQLRDLDARIAALRPPIRPSPPGAAPERAAWTPPLTSIHG